MKKLILVCSLFLVGCQSSFFESILPKPKTDTQGPYINTTTDEFVTTLGKPIDFSNITGYDDVDGLTRVYVIGKVDYDTVGTYDVIMSTTDTSGNVTEIPVKIIVKEEVVDENLSSQSAQQAQEEVVEGCPSPNAKDPEIACDMVLPEEANEYKKLFYSERGKERCENEVSNEGGSCEVITTNDGSFWGYGYKEEVVEEEEKESS